MPVRTLPLQSILDIVIRRSHDTDPNSDVHLTLAHYTQHIDGNVRPLEVRTIRLAPNFAQPRGHSQSAHRTNSADSSHYGRPQRARPLRELRLQRMHTRLHHLQAPFLRSDYILLSNVTQRDFVDGKAPRRPQTVAPAAHCDWRYCECAESLGRGVLCGAVADALRGRKGVD